MTKFTIKELLDSAVHYGHSVRRWNPKMSKYIYGTHQKSHIIDLQKTAPLLNSALDRVKNLVANNGRILFVGTKRQASPIIKEMAEACGQYYVNHRWLGGMLTNWKTISQSIQTLNDLNKQIEKAEGFTKKEILNLTRKRDKLELTLGGISKMGGLPDMIFVLDTIKESLAVEEANKLNIPIVAVVDTNSNPDLIDFPIPGNDDATKAIRLYCDLMCESVLEGIKESVSLAQLKTGEEEVSINHKKVSKDDASEEKYTKKEVKKEEVTEETAEKEPVKEDAKEETSEQKEATEITEEKN